MLASPGGVGVVIGDVVVVAVGALTVAVLMRMDRYPYRTILHRKFAPCRFPPSDFTF